MAFKMNKPIIKGSALHKEAVSKLQRLDHSSLITAAQALGQSTTPGAVDFSVDRKIDMSSYEKPKKIKKQDLDKRLEKAEELADWEKEFDGDTPGFAEEIGYTGKTKKKTTKDTEYSLDTKHGEELKRREFKTLKEKKARRAKELNVRVEDLEAKEIGGKRDYFPKEGAVGGPHAEKEQQGGTQWSDELGRFRKPEAKILTAEEAEKMVKEMKPKYPKGMNPNLAKTGEIRLNYETNTYEYTQQYYDRKAKEKIAGKKETSFQPKIKESQKTDITIRGKQISKAKLRMLDKKWANSGPSVRENLRREGYIPVEERNNAQASR